MKFVMTVISLALALGLLSTNAVFAGPPPPATAGAFMGDFNGDGQQDVLIMDSATGRLYVYVTASGIAEGAISVDVAESGLLTTLTGGQSVKGVGDFNNDGRADVLIEDSGLLVVLVNDNAVAQGSPVALDDTKTGNMTTPPAGWEVIGVADANNDGNADIYVIDTQGTPNASVYTYSTQADVGGMPSVNGAGSGSPIGLPEGWVMSVVGDLNGDGRSDMMAWNTTPTTDGGQSSNQVYTFITAVDGKTVIVGASGNPVGVPEGWGCCAAGNLTPTNLSNDFAVVNENASIPNGVQEGAIYVYALEDNGIEVNAGASAASVVLPPGWEVAGLGDFNNDGIADTLAANTNGSLLVFLNGGPGTVSGAAFLTQMPGTWGLPDSLQGMSANETAGSCDYLNASSQPECKAYSGSAWTASSARASCMAEPDVDSTWSASIQCIVEPSLGTCSVVSGAGQDDYVLETQGNSGTPALCLAAKTICDGLSGEFTPPCPAP